MLRRVAACWARSGLLLALCLPACNDDSPSRGEPPEAGSLSPRDAGALGPKLDASSDAGSLETVVSDASLQEVSTETDSADTSDTGASDAAVAETSALEPSASSVESLPADGSDAGPLDAGVADPVCVVASPAVGIQSVAMVDGSGLTITPFLSGAPLLALSWPVDFVATNPVAAINEALDENFVVALVGPGSCRVQAVSAGGALRWSRDWAASSCTTPARVSQGWLLPLTLADGTGLLELLAAENGETVAAVTLPFGPDATPAKLWSGGSHWLVGGDGQVALTELNGNALLRVGTRETPGLDGPLRELVPWGDGLVALVGETAIHRYRVNQANGALTAVGEPIVTPGAIASNVVASTDCGDKQGGGGGSHWWCDGGIVGAGGEGWLASWKLSDGSAWFVATVPETVTGLALGAEGALHSGGSHWSGIEGITRLRTIADPTSPLALSTELLTSERSCVGSPLIDTEGTLALQVNTLSGSQLSRFETRSSGLASGFSRAGGDNSSAASLSDVDALCPAGGVRLYERFVTAPLGVTIEGGVTLDDGVVVVGGRRSGAWLAGLSRGGQLLWEQTLAAGDVLDPSFGVVAQVGNGAGAAAIVTAPGGRALQTAVVNAAGTLLGSDLLDVPATASAVGAVALPDGGYLVAVDPDNTDPAAAEAWLVSVDAAGQVQGTVEYANNTQMNVRAIELVPGSTDVVIGGVQLGTAGWVARVRADGSEVWLDSFEFPTGASFVVDVLPLANGNTLVAVQEGADILLRVNGPAGELLSSSRLPAQVPVALAADAAGKLGLLNANLDLYRLTELGAPLLVASIHPGAAVPALNGATGTALVASAGGWLVLGSADFAADPVAGFVANADASGRTGCAEAGLCGGSAALSCNGGDVCSVSTCEAQSGECVDTAVPDGFDCGGGNICSAAACVPPPPLVFPQSVDVSDCFEVTSYDECVPAALSFGTLVLSADGTLDTGDPTATGTWSQPNGPSSIAFEFRDAMTSALISNFSGQSVSTTCFEGTLLTAEGLVGAFRACTN
jgi:hypothetical protein